MDRFFNFSELEQCFEEGIHFCRTTIDRAGTILILAPHRGGVEPGASELTKAIDGNDHSIYLFEGLLSSKNNVLHIISPRLNPHGIGCLIHPPLQSHP